MLDTTDNRKNVPNSNQKNDDGDAFGNARDSYFELLFGLETAGGDRGGGIAARKSSSG